MGEFDSCGDCGIQRIIHVLGLVASSTNLPWSVESTYCRYFVPESVSDEVCYVLLPTRSRILWMKCVKTAKD